MSRSARSLFVFGVYALIAGSAFIVVPEQVVATMRLPAMPAGWARVIGILAWVIGAYDIVSARAESKAFIRTSVLVRLGFAAGTVVLVLVGQMPATLMILGAADAMGAAWTAVELRRERCSGNLKSEI
jgi:hypothetical protein